MRSFYAPPPLIGEFTDFNSIAYAVEANNENTLKSALSNASEGDTITLTADITITESLTINKSITLDGNGKTITGAVLGVLKIAGTDNSNIEPIIKNLTIKNTFTNKGNYPACIQVSGSLKSLKLENVNLFTNDDNHNYPAPLYVGATGTPEITITGCTFQSHSNTQYGYTIFNYKPTKFNITETTLKGWGCVYNWDDNSGTYGKGASYTIDNCTLISQNLNKGNEDDFGVIVVQAADVQVTVTNTIMDVSGKENTQSVVIFNVAPGNIDGGVNCSGSTVTFGDGNKVKMKDDAPLVRHSVKTNTEKGGTFTVTGGMFDVRDIKAGENENKLDDFVPEGYIVLDNTDSATKSDYPYVVKKIVTGAVVSADNLSKVYGAAEPTLTASLVNVSDDDKSLVKYTISRAAGDDAGTYAITVTGDSAQLQYKNITYKNGTFTITKAESSLTKAPAAVSNLAYTGSAQALVTAGTATGGTMQYALGTDAKTAPTSGFKADIPTGTDAATYYVWYKVAGDKNHNDTTPSCITVSITNAGSSIADQSITVTKGTTTTLAVKDSSGSGSRTWALSNGAPSWVTLKKDSDEQATLTIAPDLEVKADTYICSVTVTNADNNTATGKVSITVEPTVDDALADMSEEEKEAITDLDELLTPEQKVELTDSQLEKIVEELPNLAKVDLSGAVNLTKVDMKGSTSLTTINLEGCTSLTKVNLGGCSSLTSIGGLKNNTSITEVDTSACSSLESLDVSGCTSLTSLDCSAGSIGVLNVTGCDSLAYLDCSGNKLEKLEVSSPALEDLNCGSNGLLNMDVKNSFKLKNLNCRGNSMAALDIDASKFTALETIDCSGQEISELSVTEESGYQVVDIWGYIAKFFARLFSGSTSSTVTISLNADTAAELSNIADVKAYGEDGREITSNYDASTGVVNLSEVPSRVSYKYKTGYENVSMDVSIGETITPEEHDTNLGNSSGSGGCSAGYGIFSVSALLLMFAMFTARKHS